MYNQFIAQCYIENLKASNYTSDTFKKTIAKRDRLGWQRKTIINFS